MLSRSLALKDLSSTANRTRGFGFNRSCSSSYICKFGLTLLREADLALLLWRRSSREPLQVACGGARFCWEEAAYGWYAGGG